MMSAPKEWSSETDWSTKRRLVSSSLQRRGRRESLFGHDARACFVGELTLATVLVSMCSTVLGFTYGIAGWDYSTVRFVFLDMAVMGCAALCAVAGMARVHTRQDVRGFKGILLGSFLGCILAGTMKLRPSLEVLALAMPALLAKVANAYTDQLLLEEQAMEQLPPSRPQRERDSAVVDPATQEEDALLGPAPNGGTMHTRGSAGRVSVLIKEQALEVPMVTLRLHSDTT